MGEPQDDGGDERAERKPSVKSPLRKWLLVAAGALLLALGGASAFYLVEWNKPAPAVWVQEEPKPNAAGLVPLPCSKRGALKPHNPYYCTAQRHYVTPSARAALINAARKMQPTPIIYMEASWPIGKKPMPPHLSHGDGRQIDLALYYTDLEGIALPSPPPPSVAGFGAYEPPLHERDRLCEGGKHYRPDPPKDRKWKLDDARTKQLIAAFVADKRVKRVFIEPHLKKQLGFSANPKMRFAGCNAARHDDHLHVDFY